MPEVLLISRFLLAAVFVVAGVAKLLDFPGSRKSMQDFGVPKALAGFAAVALPFAELACVVALLKDSWAWNGAIGIAALLVIFIAGIGANLARGRKPNCHCFGQLSSAPVSWKTLARNVALLALATLVIFAGRDNPGSLGAWPELSGIEIVLLSLVLVLLLLAGAVLWSLFHVLQQNGRLLLRLETVEKNLKIDPEAKQPAGIPVGEAAPVFELTDLAGKTVPLETFTKSELPVLLMFAEPSCGACEELQPKVAEWQREYVDRVAIVPISRGQVEANRDRSTRNGVTGVLLQKDRELWDAYKVTATPSAVLITGGKISSPLAAGAEAITDLVRRSTLPQPAKKGDRLPALKLPDLDGEEVDLGALRGNRTLLLFWNPGCGFCQQMLDDVKQWESKRPKGSPELLVISSGTADANRQQGFRARVLLDSVWGAGNVLGANGTPSALMIDEHGTIASEVGVGKPAVLALAGAPQKN